MPRTLTELIENESIKSRLRVVDLVQVDFPLPIGTVYWAKSQYVYGGNTYAPRVLSIGSWSRTMNPETNDVTIELGNVDGEITRIFNTVEMELAEVTLIRYYPDLYDAIDPLWVGWGGTISLSEETATWNIHFGFRGFTQRGLRKIVSNCWKVFADGVYCPYDGETLGKYVWTLTDLTASDSDITLWTSMNDTFVAGDIVQVENEKMLVLTSGAIGVAPTVTRGYDDTEIVAHAYPQTVLFKSCGKYEADCIRRGMHGPPEVAAGLRYFGGWTYFLPDPFYYDTKAGVPVFAGSGRAYALMVNRSVHGRVIPVVYGTFRLTNIPAVYSVDATEFRHSLFIISEGEVTSVAVNTLRVNSKEVDNCPPSYDAYPSENDLFHNESCMIWWGSIGQRLSYAATYAVNADQYAKNPYLVNDAYTGEGPSLSDLFAIRIRIEEGGDIVDYELPTLDVIDFVGRKVRTIQGWIDEDPNQTTSSPDPIEVAVDYCVNGKFGPRLDISRIDLTSAKTESDYCREMINNVAAGHEGETNERFLFNGAITDDQSVEAQLSFILDNCLGYYIPNGRQIQFKIRKAEAYADINALVSLTDHGTDRNILRDNGRSTLTVEQTAATDGYVNNMEVTFNDSEHSYQANTLYIFDEEMQLLAAKVLSTDLSRTVNTKQLNLNGTVTQDQAQRLGVLNLREEYLRRFKFTFKMSLKDSVGLAPGDIRKLDSLVVNSDPLKQLSQKATYVRIWKIEETDKFTATIEAYKHDNDYYDNEV